MRSEPRSARTPVWPLSLSLAATNKIDVSFSSSGYLDVSVHRVPSITLCIYVMVTEGYSAGFPHSDISGSKDICSSPKLFAAYHVFHRLLVPRHPPCALISLTNWLSFAGANYSSQIYSVISFGLGCLQNLLYFFPHDQSLDHMASDVLIFNWIINHFYSICGFQGTYLTDIFISHLQTQIFLNSQITGKNPGSHLLSHTVSSIVPSAA